MSGEYLLRELAAKSFLPAYGFPTDIAPFDNLTRARFIRERQQTEQGREDNRYRRRELASRDLTTALREYAPGSEVVLDGLVYRSAGVTLNWHIPADQTSAREIQDIRLAWRCHQCGASGSSHSLETASHCDNCGKAITPENRREFLEPAGFAVDFYKEPGNDVSSQHFVPVEAPWIDAAGDWFPLANPTLGRFRVTTRGQFGESSQPEYLRLAEAVWHAVNSESAERIRFFVGGDPHSWDIGPSPLRELVYRLAGQGVGVDLVISGTAINSLDEVDRHLLASLADHPQVSLYAIDALPMCGHGWLVAETTTQPARRWAYNEESALAFSMDWVQNVGPLITTHPSESLIS